MPETLIGEAAALAAAANWSAISLLVRSRAGRLSALTLNVIRSGTAGVLVLAATLLLAPAVLQDGLPLWAIGLLVFSATVGPVIGDTLFFESIRLIGVARAMPIASTNPLFAALFAVILLGEVVTPTAALGTVLVVAGITLVASRTSGGPVRDARLGLGLALGAALLWGLATVSVRPAMGEVDALVASAVRLPATTLIAWFYGWRAGLLTPRRELHGSVMAPIIVAGALSSLASVLFLFAVQHAGAARTAALSSTSPLFTAPLAFLLYREPITVRLMLGIVVTIAGVVLVVGG